MLEIELDIFSGMPNPRWVLTERDESELIDRVRADPGQLSPVSTASEEFGLGYRGLIVRVAKPDDDSPWGRAHPAGRAAVPQDFRVGSRPAQEPIAEWLLDSSASRDVLSGLTDEVREVASRGVQLQPGGRGQDPATVTPPDADPSSLPGLEDVGAQTPTSPPDEPQSGARGATWWACNSSYFSANAHYFNDPAHVTRNNCYCFASNHLSGVRYALPGRRGGRPATSITCGGVIDGLRADGWQDFCQSNTLTIVLVIWPNVDYHFYRLVTGGPYWWWGHKPGGTPAKYTDDCGHSIYQFNGSGYAPNNICRGPYTNFCGYFYQNNLTAYVA